MEQISFSQEVDCSANPWDLRPAVGAIMQARNWLLDRQPAQKIVYVFGEIHQFQTHMLLQEAFLRAVAGEQRKTAAVNLILGTEEPHNLSSYRKEPAIPDGKELVDAYKRLRNRGNTHSLEAHKALLKAALMQEATIRFNDIAYNQQGNSIIIDQLDPFSRDLVEQYYPHLMGKRILRSGPLSTEGIALSNIAMAERLVGQMEEMDTREAIMPCGMSHVFGDSRENIGPALFKNSLFSELNERSITVLAVLPFFKEFSAWIPPEAATALSKSTLKISEMADGYELFFSYEHVRAKVMMSSPGLF